MAKLFLSLIALLAFFVAIWWAVQYRIEWLQGKIWLWGFKYRHAKGQAEEYLSLLWWVLLEVLKYYCIVLKILIGGANDTK